MTAKRTPKHRPAYPRLTLAAQDIFRRMQTLPSYSDDWLKLEDELSAMLSRKAWEFPCVIHPDEVCPYPPDTGAARWWPYAQYLYRKLDAA